MRAVMASSVMPMSWTEAETSALSSAMRRSMKARSAAKSAARASSRRSVAVSKGMAFGRIGGDAAGNTGNHEGPVAMGPPSVYTPASRVVAPWTCPAGNARPFRMVRLGRPDPE